MRITIKIPQELGQAFKDKFPQQLKKLACKTIMSQIIKDEIKTGLLENDLLQPKYYSEKDIKEIFNK